jgi:chromosome segregation ATPase
MSQTDLQTLLIKRLDFIQDKITDIGERLGVLDGKIIMIQEKISSLEDKIEASESEGRILRGKQQENELRFSDIAREISAIRNSMERQEGEIRRINEEIRRINEEIKEMKDNTRPLMNLADAINRFHKSATYAAVLVLVFLVFYLLFSENFGVIRSIIGIFK